jgi:hypothetical protein
MSNGDIIAPISSCNLRNAFTVVPGLYLQLARPHSPTHDTAARDPVEAANGPQGRCRARNQ